MATLALAAAGAAAGGALFPAGFSALGVTLTGATLGAQAGALAGSLVDRALAAASGSATTSGPRLSDLRVMTASEGAPIPRLYGRGRLGSQVIWATDFEEEVATSGGAGKGRATSSGAGTSTYRYYANFAVAICEGPITGLGRIWADGRPLDLASVTWRLHKGDENQQPDSLIAARLGAGNPPAYRGVAYVVFEHMALADFGNRLPQLSFEVFRAVDALERKIRSVTLIPGGGEFSYATAPVAQAINAATATSENVHTLQGGADVVTALDQLQETLPNVANVSLVVGWFGSDLRVEQCRIAPLVDDAAKSTTPVAWSVAGLSRADASVVSRHEGRAAYGGTPSDDSVLALIAEMKSRGLGVTLSPFLFMDVPAGNAFPDPYSTAQTQPAYPWRGRITVTPAPGRTGTPDKTAAATTAMSAFIGTAQPSHFTVTGGRVTYTGPAEWSYRRFILHHAALAEAAGGVDAFLIGSEMRALSQVRSGATTYPFVDALVALAADVRSMLGPATRITYAADWSEYFGHHPAEAPADTIFNLDPLWASPAIDAVGIDVYWPLSDWRDGRNHLDAQAGTASIYDLGYLRGNITGGEGFDWYYASTADRDAQVRTPITDGAGKPWLYRFKDIRSWWSNAHYNRIAGIDSGTPTAWVPQAKPIWFTELGCAAVDKGANAPNVFVDAKSAETRLPPYSRGTRDDFMQRRYLQAFHTALDPQDPAYASGANPVSSVYGAPMVDLARLTVYTWDARPWPAFPSDTDTWGDAANWRLGHWITGRFANAPLDSTIAAILSDYGFQRATIGSLAGSIAGLVIDRVMSARDALSPLQLAGFIDVRESEGRLLFSARGAARTAAVVTPDDLVETRAGEPLSKLVRGQDSDLPGSAKISFVSGEGNYPAAVEEARRLTGASVRVATADLGLVLDPEQAAQIADMWLFETWASRERASFVLPPSRLALEPGDLVVLDDGARQRPLRLTEIGEHGAREVAALSIDTEVYTPALVPSRTSTSASVSGIAGQPLVRFLDLPLLDATDADTTGYVAAAQSPWPGSIAVYRSPEQSGFLRACTADLPAVMGRTLDPLTAAGSGRQTSPALFRVALDRGALASVSLLALFAGANRAAIANPDGEWEILQFQSAELVAPATYALHGLLRGQMGTEHAMRAPLSAGAPFVLLDGAIASVDLTADDIGLALYWRSGPASRDLGDAAYVTTVHGFRGVGRRPLAPVHIRCARTANGDATLTWLRRTRSGGDSWEGLDVPVGETSELYSIEVLSGAAVVRTFTSTTPSQVYTAAQQAADFGSVPAAFAVRISQVSATAGPGIAASATV